MLEWLNSNAGAVQGLSAAISAGVTVVLVAITWWYAHLTNRIAKSSQDQLHALIQPVPEMRLTTGFQGETHSRGVRTYSKSGSVTIRNVGAGPLKIKSLSAVIQRWEEYRFAAQYEVELTEFRNRIVPAQQSIEQEVNIEVKDKVDFDALFGLRLDCSDLSELVTRSYSWHPTHGMR